MTDKENTSDQAIHRAAALGDVLELERLLTDDRTLIEANSARGWKPLHYAAQSSSLDCVRFLLDHRAQVNSLSLEDGATPIFKATTQDMIDLLVERGANVAAITKHGWVPLYQAVRDLNAETVCALLRHGADVKYKPKIDCYSTTISLAIRSSNDCSYDPEQAESIISILLDAGAETDAATAFGTTALHEACKWQYENIIRLLLRHGANPNLRDVNRQNSFDIAANNPAILSILEPYRCDNQELPKPLQTPDQLIQRLIRLRLITEKDLRPCSEDEIARLENHHSVILPLTYKCFLRTMGKGAGEFLDSDHWLAYYEQLLDSDYLGSDLKIENREALEELPDNYFVFASRLADVYLYFIADGKYDDPPIFAWNDSGHQGQVHRSFWDFIEEMVEYYEFYCDPERFTQSSDR